MCSVQAMGDGAVNHEIRQRQVFEVSWHPISSDLMENTCCSELMRDRGESGADLVGPPRIFTGDPECYAYSDDRMGYIVHESLTRTWGRRAQIRTFHERIFGFPAPESNARSSDCICAVC